jgi:hypothetical protein
MLDNRKYVIYDELYKKYNNTIDSYILEIKHNYHISKRTYLENINYQRFITIIKQLCKLHGISWESKRIYQNNTYKIFYIFCL